MVRHLTAGCRVVALALPPRVVRSRRVAAVLSFVLAAPLAAQSTPPDDATAGPVSGRAGLMIHGMRFLSSVQGEVPVEFEGTVTGLEAVGWARGTRFGAHAHYLAGDGPPNAGRFTAIGLTGLYGSPRLAGELGYMRRAAYSDDTNRELDRTFGIARLGVRGHSALGGTGVTFGLRGSAYVPAGADPEKGATGFDLESEARWQPGRRQVSVSLGYRFERLRVEKAEQEVGFVTLGLAYHFGGDR